jgi:hypothetical protein
VLDCPYCIYLILIYDTQQDAYYEDAKNKNGWGTYGEKGEKKEQEEEGMKT